MRISYNWLKEFVNINVEAAEIDRVLTNLGIEVEKIYNNREKFEKFYVGLVEKCESVENSDHLSYCEVTTGNNLYKVICGAPNVSVGQKVVLGTAGAVVPANGIKLEKRKIRGYESNGMICSKFELEIEEDHSGIWVLPDNATLGQPLADYLNEDDIIFEISITPNRGDCLSHLGIARELAAYFNIPVKMPQINISESNENISDNIKVEIKDLIKNPRYVARLIKNVNIKESPEWLKKRLISVGLRPINNVVDVTNLVLMEVNQPLHSFDFDKISGKKIVIRTAREGEKFTTLDSKERILDSEMLMICDSEKPVAIAGVMGGENSEITNQTSNVLIEAASFNPSSVRRTSKKLAIQSESSYRFERGVDFDKIIYAANRAASLIAELSGGQVVKGIVDEYPVNLFKPEINLKLSNVNKVIGISLNLNEVKSLLTRLNFDINKDTSESLIVVPPSYRNDIELEIDVIEEIARLYGYENIEPLFVSQIDSNSSTIPEKLAIPNLRKKIKNFYVNRGYNEILTQNMIEPNVASKFTEKFVEIANPLGEELSIMRPNILPSLLKSISNNVRVGNHSLKLFEIGKEFNISDEKNLFIDGVKESEKLLLGIYGYSELKQWSIPERNYDFYDIKGSVIELLDFLKMKKYKFEKLSDNIPGFSANKLSISINQNQIGIFGEINKELLKIYDIEKPVFTAIIDLEKIYQLQIPEPKFTKISPFPPALRDIAFVVDESTPAGDILAEIKSNAGNYLKELSLFDIYQGKQLGEMKKSLAFNLIFSAENKTLTDEEIDPIMKKVIEKIETKFSAIVRKF